LKDISRIGCRFNYLLATKSIEEAEKRLLRSALMVSIPESMNNSGYNIRTQHIILNILKDTIEYRIELYAIIRQEAINPQGILRGDSRYFSKNQKNFYLAQQNQLAQYSVNPMYAISLDIDCSTLNPTNMNVEDFILNQKAVVCSDFLPILEKL